ncbi:hypothetical protein ACIQW7_11275 [Peribacillus simplex]|uniref:hypothetical protein n=1 Tax=Peribacillus simplex TaxID=1478 RepID=UPI003803CF7A
MTNTVENKRAEYTAGMESKIAEMDTALQAVQAKFNELEDVKASGKQAVAEMEANKAQLKEEINFVTDLGEGKLLLQQVGEIEKDIELQAIVTQGQAVKIAGELEELFKTFYAVHASAKTFFSVLDKEYVETMSVRTLEEDTAKMSEYASKINTHFGVAGSTLIDAGIVGQGDRFYRTAQTAVHLGQTDLMTMGVNMKREMAKVKYQLNL